MNTKCMTYNVMQMSVFLQSNCLSFIFLLRSANVCTKDHSDICYANSRTYLMVFSLIWGSIWWIDIQ